MRVHARVRSLCAHVVSAAFETFGALKAGLTLLTTMNIVNIHVLVPHFETPTRFRVDFVNLDIADVR